MVSQTNHFTRLMFERDDKSPGDKSPQGDRRSDKSVLPGKNSKDTLVPSLDAVLPLHSVKVFRIV